MYFGPTCCRFFELFQFSSFSTRDENTGTGTRAISRVFRESPELFQPKTSVFHFYFKIHKFGHKNVENICSGRRDWEHSGRGGWNEQNAMMFTARLACQKLRGTLYRVISHGTTMRNFYGAPSRTLRWWGSAIKKIEKKKKNLKFFLDKFFSSFSRILVNDRPKENKIRWERSRSIVARAKARAPRNALIRVTRKELRGKIAVRERERRKKDMGYEGGKRKLCSGDERAGGVRRHARGPIFRVNSFPLHIFRSLNFFFFGNMHSLIFPKDLRFFVQRWRTREARARDDNIAGNILERMEKKKKKSRKHEIFQTSLVLEIFFVFFVKAQRTRVNHTLACQTAYARVSSRNVQFIIWPNKWTFPKKKAPKWGSRKNSRSLIEKNEFLRDDEQHRCGSLAPNPTPYIVRVSLARSLGRSLAL